MLIRHTFIFVVVVMLVRAIPFTRRSFMLIMLTITWPASSSTPTFSSPSSTATSHIHFILSFFYYVVALYHMDWCIVMFGRVPLGKYLFFRKGHPIDELRQRLATHKEMKQG
ncbi:MAG TPA: hypothetical protein VJ824_03300 [Bacillota bacterium]|nr:hypothetical protein [Bacillota bacterium]